MSAGRRSVAHDPSAPRRRDPARWQLPLVLVVSSVYERLFLHHWINVVDEGWPLYAAMRLHAGGVLYDDVFFVFPPGHLLSAWLAYAIEPPGVVWARVFYSAFNVALCGVLYLLGRRLMPHGFALLGALLLAVAAPASHQGHLLFGYRYLLFSALALLAFARRLESGKIRWMLAAGVCAGVALCFRLTPAFAVSCGIGVGILASTREWRSWLRDGAGYALGFVAAVAPVAVWLLGSVGPETLWREVFVRPVAMTDLQSLPVPSLALPEVWERKEISEAFVALLFRLGVVVYAGYAARLGVRWLRCAREGRPFDAELLLAATVWGGLYFVRSFGRADEPHLSSAIPPLCLLMAHLLFAMLRSDVVRRTVGAPGRVVEVAASIAALAAWIGLLGSDRYLDPALRGDTPIEVTGSQVRVREEEWWRILDPKVRMLRRWAQPGERILDLSGSPLFYVLAGRLGPGHHDVVMPGTFSDEREELAFLETLRSAPPAAVIVPERDFDGMESRAARATAPRVTDWAQRHYRARGPTRGFRILVPRRGPESTAPSRDHVRAPGEVAEPAR